MFLLIYSLIVILGLSLIWPKGSIALDICTCILLATMVGVCTTHADYTSYLLAYESTEYLDVFQSTKPGWVLLNALWRSLGATYVVFISFNTFLFTSAMLAAVRKVTNNTPFFSSLILIYPGVMNLVQIRQYFAMCLAVVAFVALVKGSRASKILFILLILAAASIHASALLFMVLLLAPPLQANPRIYFLAVSMLLVLCFFTDIPVRLAQLVFNDEVSRSYFAGYGGRTSDLSRLFTVFETTTAYLILIVAEKSFKRTNHSTKCDLVIDDSFAYLRFLSILFIALTPVLIMNTDFLRLHRFALIYICVHLANVVEKIQDNYVCRVILKTALSAYLLMLFYGLVWLQAAETVVIPMFGL